jgi:hypothetical protein
VGADLGVNIGKRGTPGRENEYQGQDIKAPTGNLGHRHHEESPREFQDHSKDDSNYGQRNKRGGQEEIMVMIAEFLKGALSSLILSRCLSVTRGNQLPVCILSHVWKRIGVENVLLFANIMTS